MTERRDRKGTEGEHPNPKFDKVFSAMLDYSRRANVPVTSDTFGETFAIPDQYHVFVRINPAFADTEGRPVFAIIDTYVDRLHSHQVAIQATWEGDNPTTVIDPARVGGDRPRFNIDDLADIALKIIEIKDKPRAVVFPIANSGRPN